MIFIFKGLEMKFRSLIWELDRIYGVGFTRAQKILNRLGLSMNLSVGSLNYYFWDCISYIMKVKFITEDRLKIVLRQRLNYFLDLRLKRGLRFSKGLPTRGQRTHSNGKQNKYHRRNEI